MKGGAPVHKWRRQSEQRQDRYVVAGICGQTDSNPGLINIENMAGRYLFSL